MRLCRWQVALTIGWVLATAAGMGWMITYGQTPGAAGSSPHDWPVASSLPRRVDGFTLLMFAHPRCPCTDASLHELRHLQAESAAPVSIQLVYVKPPGVAGDWAAEAVRASHVLTGISVTCDQGGSESLRFGVNTSGHVLLYNADGKLLFSGGITASRGQRGENAGRALAAGLLSNRVTAPSTRYQLPVFGCPLLSSDPGGRPQRAAARCAYSQGPDMQAGCCKLAKDP